MDENTNTTTPSVIVDHIIKNSDNDAGIYNVYFRDLDPDHNQEAVETLYQGVVSKLPKVNWAETDQSSISYIQGKPQYFPTTVTSAYQAGNTTSAIAAVGGTTNNIFIPKVSSLVIPSYTATTEIQIRNNNTNEFTTTAVSNNMIGSIDGQSLYAPKARVEPEYDETTIIPAEQEGQEDTVIQNRLIGTIDGVQLYIPRTANEEETGTVNIQIPSGEKTDIELVEINNTSIYLPKIAKSLPKVIFGQYTYYFYEGSEGPVQLSSGALYDEIANFASGDTNESLCITNLKNRFTSASSDKNLFNTLKDFAGDVEYGRIGFFCCGGQQTLVTDVYTKTINNYLYYIIFNCAPILKSNFEERQQYFIDNNSGPQLNYTMNDILHADLTDEDPPIADLYVENQKYTFILDAAVGSLYCIKDNVYTLNNTSITDIQLNSLLNLLES